jgi:hypothetical protein
MDARKRKSIAIGLMLIVCGILSATMLLIFFPCIQADSYRIANLPVESGINIEIFGDCSWEVCEPLQFTIQDHGITVASKTYFGNKCDRASALHFQVISGPQICGVVEADSPTVLLILYNKRTKEVWPYELQQNNSSYNDVVVKGDLLFEQFESEHVEDKWELKTRVASGRLLKIE